MNERNRSQIPPEKQGIPDDIAGLKNKSVIV